MAESSAVSSVVEKRVFLELQRSISKYHSSDNPASGELEKHILYAQYLLVGKYGSDSGSSLDRLAWLHADPIRLECHKEALNLRGLANAR